MFPTRHRLGYDFQKPENLIKWQGIFIDPLRTVLEQVHYTLTPKDEALEYVESLMLRLLGVLCARPSPRSIQDVADRVRRTFPSPIDRWAISDAEEAVKRGMKKSKLAFPVDEIYSLLQKEVFRNRLEPKVSFYMVAILEYVSADILKLTGNYVKNIRHAEITREDVRVAMCADKVLMDMFHPDRDAGPSSSEGTRRYLQHRTSVTLEEAVRDLIKDEKQYVRDLQMIVKVFRGQLLKLVKAAEDLDDVFSNITDIYELTLTLLKSLEEVVRKTDKEQFPLVGTCFEELAEAAEFEAYVKYTKDMVSSKPQDALDKVLSVPEVYDGLHLVEEGFYEAVKFYLPKLLQGPIWHFFVYFDYIKMLHRLTPVVQDKECYEQSDGILRPIHIELLDLLDRSSRKDLNFPMHIKMRKQITIEKMSELRRCIDGWDRKNLAQCCEEFIREDTLYKMKYRRRRSERHAFLFDNFLILCKPNSQRRFFPFMRRRTNFDLRLKEKLFIQRCSIFDREDTEDVKNAFEIRPKSNRKVVLVAKSAEEKKNWMADLMMLNTKSTLEMLLDNILLIEDTQDKATVDSE